jgi:hypothetical protein
VLARSRQRLKNRCEFLVPHHPPMIKNQKPPLKVAVLIKSGRWDLNPGPLTPHASALAGLRHAPKVDGIIVVFYMFGKHKMGFHQGTIPRA